MPKDSERLEITFQLVELMKTARLRRKFSLNEIATRSGLSHTMVMRVEKGERVPTIDTLLRIADALQIDLSAVLRKAIKRAKRTHSAR